MIIEGYMVFRGKEPVHWGCAQTEHECRQEILLNVVDSQTALYNKMGWHLAGEEFTIKKVTITWEETGSAL